MQSLAAAPADGAGAPAAFIEVTSSYIETARLVADAYQRIDDGFASILDSFFGANPVIVDAIDAGEVERRWLLLTRRLSRPWQRLLELPSLRRSVASFLFARREHANPPALAAGVRRICRGRAPPSLSTCNF